MSETKRCAKCGQVVSVTEFTKSERTRDRLGSYCRACRRIESEERRRARGVKPRPVRRVLAPGSTKQCRTCSRVLDITEFYPAKVNSDGFQNDCKVCHNQKTRDWHWSHREHRNAIQRKYYERKKAARADASTESDT